MVPFATAWLGFLPYWPRDEPALCTDNASCATHTVLVP